MVPPVRAFESASLMQQFWAVGASCPSGCTGADARRDATRAALGIGELVITLSHVVVLWVCGNSGGCVTCEICSHPMANMVSGRQVAGACPGESLGRAPARCRRTIQHSMLRRWGSLRRVAGARPGESLGRSPARCRRAMQHGMQVPSLGLHPRHNAAPTQAARTPRQPAPRCRTPRRRRWGPMTRTQAAS